MIANFRKFEAGPDPFGRTWQVEFRWLQNGISIRHADTVDVKFEVMTEGEPKQERVVAIQHADLLEVSRKFNHPLTDTWCCRIAASHLAQMITNWEDIENTLASVRRDDLERYAAALEQEHKAQRA